LKRLRTAIFPLYRVLRRCILVIIIVLVLDLWEYDQDQDCDIEIENDLDVFVPFGSRLSSSFHLLARAFRFALRFPLLQRGKTD
jgi:hypothetical protein